MPRLEVGEQRPRERAGGDGPTEAEATLSTVNEALVFSLFSFFSFFGLFDAFNVQLASIVFHVILHVT